MATSKGLLPGRECALPGVMGLVFTWENWYEVSDWSSKYALGGRYLRFFVRSISILKDGPLKRVCRQLPFGICVVGYYPFGSFDSYLSPAIGVREGD